MSKIEILNLQVKWISTIFDTSKVIGGAHGGCIPLPEIPSLPDPFPKEDNSQSFNL